MTEREDTIKKILYEELDKIGEDKIIKLLGENESKRLIELAISNTLHRLDKKTEQDMATLCTGILHYVLTNCLIPSQRKVVHKGEEIDIVIPGLRTLTTNPDKAVVILIPKTTDQNSIKSKIEKISTLQPKKEQVWLVTPIDYPGYRVFSINNSFSSIVDEIKQFLKNTKTPKLRIFKI